MKTAKKKYWVSQDEQHSKCDWTGERAATPSTTTSREKTSQTGLDDWLEEPGRNTTSKRKVMKRRKKTLGGERGKKPRVMLAFTDRRFPPSTATHLSDGRAELALKDLLQGLELVSGDVARLLQLLQQLDGPGNIWQKQGETGGRGRWVYVCGYSCQRDGGRGRGKKNAPHSITLTAQPCERRRSESMGGIMEIDLAKASWGKKDRLHWLGSMHSDQGRRNKSGTHLLKGNTSCWEQVPAGITKLSH